jgi:Leucine-rich repeat (LRR) protein
VLNLDANALTALPNEIGELKNLECLTVSCNKLQTLPPSYRKLTKLESLHLASNAFQAFPLVICQLEAMKFLDLSCNQIDLLPPTLSKLSSLRTLMLFNNKISEWPDALCDLIELRTLWLGKNELKRLPARFGQLKYLDWSIYPLSSNIDENPLMSPPLNVCKMGIQAIRDFLKGMTRKGSIIPANILELRKEL